jgi:expansin (peptidoglycan-binding protein)
MEKRSDGRREQADCTQSPPLEWRMVPATFHVNVVILIRMSSGSWVAVQPTPEMYPATEVRTEFLNII